MSNTILIFLFITIIFACYQSEIIASVRSTSIAKRYYCTSINVHAKLLLYRCNKRVDQLLFTFMFLIIIVIFFLTHCQHLF